MPRLTGALFGHTPSVTAVRHYTREDRQLPSLLTQRNEARRLSRSDSLPP